MSPVNRDRRRALLRLGLLVLAIVAGFAAVTLAGVSPAEAQRWVDGAGAAGPLVFVLAGGALGLVLFPGHVTATVAGVLFGTLGGIGLMLAAALLGAGLALLVARRLGADALHSLLGPRARPPPRVGERERVRAALACRLASPSCASAFPASIVNYLAAA